MPRGKNKESVWVAETKNLTELVDALETNIRIHTGIEEFKFEDRLPELGMARTLFEKCGYDQSLAMEVINAYFEAPHTLIWYKPKSMSMVIWDRPNGSGTKGCFSIAIAFARSKINRAMPKKIKQMEFFL